MGDTLNWSQECYPVRRGKKGRKQQWEGEERERETERERERGQEDKPVWQVCVTVHSPSCKADGVSKRRREREELGADVITERCLHCGPVSAQWSGTDVAPTEGEVHVCVCEYVDESKSSFIIRVCIL